MGSVVVQSANAVAAQVRAAFTSQSGPAFSADHIPINLGRGSSNGRGRGRGGGQQRRTTYSFTVLLLNQDHNTIPRRSQRTELEQNGRVKRLEISRGAPPGTTFRKLVELFPLLASNRDFVLLRCVGNSNLVPHVLQPIDCSARDLNSIRGQGSLYLRLPVGAITSQQSSTQAGSSTGQSTSTQSNTQAQGSRPVTAGTSQQISTQSGSQQSTPTQSNSQAQDTRRIAPSNRGRLWRQRFATDPSNSNVDEGHSSSDEELVQMLEQSVQDGGDIEVADAIRNDGADAGDNGGPDSFDGIGSDGVDVGDNYDADVGVNDSLDDGGNDGVDHDGGVNDGRDVVGNDVDAGGSDMVVGGHNVTDGGDNYSGNASADVHGGSYGVHGSNDADASTNDGTADNDNSTTNVAGNDSGGNGNDSAVSGPNADDVVEVTRVTNNSSGTRNHGSSKHGSGVEVVSIVDIDMDSPVVCGTIVPSSNCNGIFLEGDRDVTDDLHALLQVLSAPCPLQLHHYSGHVVDHVADISRGRPLLVLFWGDRFEGSVRLFAENVELCHLSNTQTSVWPVRRQNEDYKICFKQWFFRRQRE